MNKSLLAGTASACLALGSALAQDCTATRAAASADLSRGEGIALLSSMAAACKSQQPEQFFRLQTSSARALAQKATDKAGLLRNYCEFTQQAMKTLGGDATTGLHTVGPYKSRTRCGGPASYWFVHTKQGELALRLEVAVESGQLRIDTH